MVDDHLRPLLTISLVLLAVVLGVLLGLPPLLEAAERTAVSIEVRRVRVAIDAYQMLDRIPPIPARAVPRRILQGDPDAPFARFMERPTRHLYRWFEDGLGLHTVRDEPREALAVLAVAALAHDLVRGEGGLGRDGPWQEQLQHALERHVMQGNALGVVNRVTGREDILRASAVPWPDGAAPAVLLSDAPVHSFRYLLLAPEPGLGGTIVVTATGGAGSAEVFVVHNDGRPAYLFLVGRPSAQPRRGRRGW